MLADHRPRWSLAASLLVLACRADATPTPADGSDPPADAAVDAEPAAVAAPAPAPAKAPEATTLATTSPTPEPAVAADEVDAAKPPDAEPARPKKVLILGDSLAATGFGALLEKKLDAHADVQCFRKGKSASGLARPDFFDWPAEAKKQIDARDPDLVVVIMGGNDGQDMTRRPKDKSGAKRVSWGEPDAWKLDYRARVDAFLSDIADDERKVLWLGLPKMGMRSLEVKLEIIRAIQKDAVDALGDRASYIDTIPFVTDTSGALLSEARVGKHRKLQQIRAEDRIHFTMSGSEYFADRVYPEVLRVLGIADPDEKAAAIAAD